MSLGDWFRRIFTPASAPNQAGADDDATLRAEYGEQAGGHEGPGGIAGGAPGLAGLEDAEAAEHAVEGDEPRT
jgi:hypothetical protein